MSPFLCALVLIALVVPAAPASAAALAPDVVPLAVAAPAGARPTALAAADLDADGVPDLIVAYASGATTTLVAYPGDAEAIYPAPASAGYPTFRTGGGWRTFMATPFGAPRVLATVDGAVAELVAVDADADGIEDVVAAPALGPAALLVAIGDGTVVASETLDATAVARLRARAAALAPRHLEASAPVALADVPSAFFMETPDGTRLGRRTTPDVERALRNPTKPIMLAPPPMRPRRCGCASTPTRSPTSSCCGPVSRRPRR